MTSLSFGRVPGSGRRKETLLRAGNQGRLERTQPSSQRSNENPLRQATLQSIGECGGVKSSQGVEGV